MDNIYRKSFPILSFHLDSSGQARLTTLANFFQEMAYQHANQLGFGYRDLKKNRTMWVLSRMKIEVIRYPVWDEVVTLETWHRGLEKLFGMRDFRIRDRDGSDLALAGSAWLIVDVASRRPVRHNDPSFLNSTWEEQVFDSKLDKIKLPAHLERKGVHTVVHSDLDVVGHVNNVKYMEWCIDTALSPGTSAKRIKSLEINFMHEARPGDQVIISGAMHAEKATGEESSRKTEERSVVRGRGQHGKADDTSEVHYFAGHLEDKEREVFRVRMQMD